MRFNISNFTKESRIYLRVYWTTFIAVAVFFFAWTLVSYFTGHEVLIVNKLQNPVVEATK